MTDEPDGQGRNEKGLFTNQFDDEDVLAIVEREGLVASSDVADELGVSRRTAYRRLKALADEGRVAERRAGKTSTILWTAAGE